MSITTYFQYKSKTVVKCIIFSLVIYMKADNLLKAIQVKQFNLALDKMSSIKFKEQSYGQLKMHYIKDKLKIKRKKERKTNGEKSLTLNQSTLAINRKKESQSV